jgi:hypothetical protein
MYLFMYVCVCVRIVVAVVSDDVQRKPLCAAVRRGLNSMQPIITKVWRLLMGYWSCLLSSP